MKKLALGGAGQALAGLSLLILVLFSSCGGVNFSGNQTPFIDKPTDDQPPSEGPVAVNPTPNPESFDGLSCRAGSPEEDCDGRIPNPVDEDPVEDNKNETETLKETPEGDSNTPGDESGDETNDDDQGDSNNPGATPTPSPPDSPAPTPAPTDPPVPTATPAPTASPTPPGPQKVTEKLRLDKGPGKIDLVFIVDNSASMLDEIAMVREQMAQFIPNLKDRSDVRLMIISLADEVTEKDYATLTIDGMAMDGIDVIWVNTLVHSQQFALVAALASCPADSNSLVQLDLSYDYTVCNEEISGLWGLRPQFDDLNGVLTPYFRPGAKQVFVAVTDDDIITSEAASMGSPVPAYFIDHTNMAAAINAANPDVDPFVFAFASLEDKERCDNYTPAVSLQELTMSTGGSFYDICAADWTPYFEELADRVVIIANENFQLSQAGAKKILSIKQGDEVLPEGTYELGDMGKLYVDPSYLDAMGVLELTVEYEY